MSIVYTGTIHPTLRERQQWGWRPFLPEPGLVEAVNLAIYLERPLLIKGAQGIGKSNLAKAVAYEFTQRYMAPYGQTWPYEEWRITSTSQARDGLYTFDAVGRLRDAQLAALGDLAQVEAKSYRHLGPLGRAMMNEQRTVIFIDKIDRADIDFPNDLLLELDEARFYVAETNEWLAARSRPIVFVTSNDEKALPNAFLRRCLFYYMEFPAPERFAAMMAEWYPGVME
ncbi:MAG: MoxR family ATPase [Ardenticatenaceae bacterium]|nr:MoxR family ATPase [Ardenticatenaceae bacterium]